MMQYIMCPKCELNFIKEEEKLCSSCKVIQRPRTKNSSKRYDYMPRGEGALLQVESFDKWLALQAPISGIQLKSLRRYMQALLMEWHGSLSRAKKLGIEVKRNAFEYETAEDFERVVAILQQLPIEIAGSNFRLGAEWYLKFLQSKQ